MTKKALVVLSGGQDSTTCLGWAMNNFDEAYCLTFDYGQRHKIEIESARMVCQHFRNKTSRFVGHEIVDFPEILIGDSPLVNGDNELERYANHDEMEKIIGDRVEKTFVPMRNAVFLTLAANRAAAWGCDTIITGVCQGDNANYPDCRATFIEAAETMINEALGRVGALNEILLETPLIHLTKAETCGLALDLPHTFAALAYSHTAYDGSFPPNGDDHASVLRAEGFRRAGLPDPLILRAHHAGLCALPETDNYKLPHGPEDLDVVDDAIAEMRRDWNKCTR